MASGGAAAWPAAAITPPQSDLSQTVLSACTGGVITAFVVTPLDVLKTRTQLAASRGSGSAAVLQMVRTEGIISLWGGLHPSLLMTVPSCAIYFTSYEKIREAVGTGGSQRQRDLAPVVAAAGAKVLASTTTAPLELMRTRMQADRALLDEGMVGGAMSLVRQQGVLGLFRGLGPMLLRDVPFSCIYWVGYERLKQRFMEEEGELSAAASFVSGGTAGALATLMTMPLDVVKTRRQVERGSAGAQSETLGAMVARIVRLEGPRALLAGVVPRLAKMAPSCAIMIASFEMGKKWFAVERIRVQ